MGLKDFFGTTQSKNLGGHNTPKAGEQGFQKSQIIKGKTPTVGISKHSITSNPILTLGDLDYINKRISDAKVIDLKLVIKLMEETELGQRWNKYPKEKNKTQKDIQETLDYIVLMNGRFSTFLNTTPELRILITPSISKRIYKQAILIDLAKKNKLESILNDDQYSALTKCFAKISLDIWAEGQTLAKEIEEYNRDNKELWSGADLGFFGVSEKRFEHQAREPESSFRNLHLHLPLKEAGVIYAKRTKEIDELLEESKKTALTPERWIQKIEEKAEKASRRYRIMTEHGRNGRAFADDDGLPGILLTQEEYSDNTLRSSWFNIEELEKANRTWQDSYSILKEVRKVFEVETLTKEDIKE